MIALHYWPTPNGCKIAIALEEMGLPYEIVPVNIGAGEQFKPEFLAISPNNRVPAIVDPDAAGRRRADVGVPDRGHPAVPRRKAGQFLPQDLRGQYEVDCSG